ncbi:hypothetical protein [Flavobacterium branchiicola]|uniref:Lipoprotein n=1 Tax=Flavobacterium branchiicola TaxID=1114875 RepID=A0ABV9PJR6_9FLAO|nr:hypothetical protein [Flavobacterium branchiicola]MBS7255597.1 hypothetical protein [Flavobacterium branchiicola]
MRKIYFAMLLTSAITSTSCDPSQNMLFTNNSKSNVKVKLIVNAEVKNEQLDEIKKGDSIVFNLIPQNAEKNQGLIYFGRGRWNEETMVEISKSIKSIEIENEDKKIIYKSQNEINNLFFENKKGLLFKSIDITIDDDLLN